MDKREHSLNWLKSGSKELKRSAEEVVKTGGIEHRGISLKKCGESGGTGGGGSDW